MRNHLILTGTVLLSALAIPASAEDLARVTTTVTQEVVSGGVDVETPTMLTLAKQAVILVDGVPTLPSITTEQTLRVWDKRGTASPISVTVEVTPMRNGDAQRDVTLTPIGYAGQTQGILGRTAATQGTTLTQSDFITAPPMVNRVFEAQLQLTTAQLTGEEALAGAWNGTITFTVN